MSKSLQDVFERLQGIQRSADEEHRAFVAHVNGDSYLDLAHVESSFDMIQQSLDWLEKQNENTTLADFKDYLKRREEDNLHAVDQLKFRLAQLEGSLATINDLRELPNKSDKNYHKEALKVIKRAAVQSKKINKIQVLCS